MTEFKFHMSPTPASSRPHTTSASTYPGTVIDWSSSTDPALPARVMPLGHVRSFMLRASAFQSMACGDQLPDYQTIDETQHASLGLLKWPDSGDGTAPAADDRASLRGSL